MGNFLQLHALIPFGPANLNRDETGRPKTAMIGGAERLRISSQALKRSWRISEIFASRLEGHLGHRTRLMGEELRRMLISDGMEDEEAVRVTKMIASVVGAIDAKETDEPAKTKQLAFISDAEWHRAREIGRRILGGEEIEKVVPADIFLERDTAADIALFGRMLADSPAFNREASLQVSQAITTHEAMVQEDYFTAVDDWNREDQSGAGFVDVQGFGAGLFLIHFCVNRKLLNANVDGDESVANSALQALTEAAITVAPRGKRSSYASNSRAAYVLVERDVEQPLNLMPAFESPVPVDAENQEGTIHKSIDQLEDWYRRISKAYSHQAETYTMNLLKGEEGEGTLQEMLEFVVQ